MTAPETSLFPLVGRDHEFAILRERLADTVAGRSGLVLIGGEAGIGKTALAEALCREAAKQGALVLVGRCYDLTDTPPYGPWLESFAPHQDAGGASALPPIFAEHRIAGDIASQAALFDRATRFVGALAARQPLILLLEDLHWADPVSLDLLRFLARSIAALPMLILATYRRDELTRHHPLYQLLPHLVREARAERLELRPLDDAATWALVHGRYPLDAREAARLVAYLRSRGEGNALFIGELLRSLEETNNLRRDGAWWVLGDLDEATVPPLLRQVIDARVDRLGAESQRLLAVAAVIGQTVPLDVWQMVAMVSDEAVLNAVAEAQAAHILAESADGRGAVFTHALIREALYEGTRPTQRRRWHEAVGALLVDRPDAEPDVVAYHFQQAGDVRAVPWLVRAGERAEKTFALLTAAERYEAAIAILAGTDSDPGLRCVLLARMAWLRRWSRPAESLAALDTALHLAQRNMDPVLAAACQIVRGIQRCRMGVLIDGLPDIEAGASAIDTLGSDDRARLGHFGLAGMPFDHESMWGSLILRLGSSGRTERAMVLGLPLIAGSSHPGPLADVHFGLAYAQAVRGEVAAARRSFAAARVGCHAQENPAGVAETALYELECAVLPYTADALAERRALADEANAAWVRASGAVPPDVPIRIAHLPLLILEGRWDEAWELGLVLRRAGRYTSRRYLANRAIGPLASLRGDYSHAWEAIADTLPRGHETPPGDARFFDATILQRLAVALALDANDLATAQTWLEANDNWLGWSGATLGKSEGQAPWARYYRAIGDRERASAHADRARADASDPRQPLALLAAHRLLGELDTETGRYAAADAHLHASLALADDCAAPYERALTLLAIAELRAAIGEPEVARTLLDDVRAICEPLGAKPALAHAEVLAAHLGGARSSSTAYPDRLTAREVEILRLIAAGKSNRDIATTLSISVRTVNRHIENLYGKIGAHGKADATAYALRHQLA